MFTHLCVSCGSWFITTVFGSSGIRGNTTTGQWLWFSSMSLDVWNRSQHTMSRRPRRLICPIGCTVQHYFAAHNPFALRIIRILRQGRQVVAILLFSSCSWWLPIFIFSDWLMSSTLLFRPSTHHDKFLVHFPDRYVVAVPSHMHWYTLWFFLFLQPQLP